MTTVGRTIRNALQVCSHGVECNTLVVPRTASIWMSLSVACSCPATSTEHGPFDSGPLDSGPFDSGRRDSDFDAREAASPDAGSRGDAQMPVDSASPSCAEPLPHDLDLDGTPESQLALVACGDTICVEIQGTTSRQVSIEGGALTSALAVHYAPFQVDAIGDHTGDGYSEAAVAHFLADGRPALSIVDLQSGNRLGMASAPTGITAFGQYQLSAFVGLLAAPDGKLYPYLAPSFGDSPDSTWGYACIFRPGTAVTGACGADFITAGTTLSGNWFREVGALSRDEDRDGWEDLTLIFHQTLLTISGQTGGRLAATTFDVAAQSEPNSPMWFHSGRLYGTHSAFTADDGSLRHLIVGGAPNGAFGDAHCNVTRFVATLTSPTPATRDLAWSHYYSFGSSSFSVFSPEHAANPAAVVSRQGDFMNWCVHRYSDSRTRIDGVESVLFNYFAVSAPVSDCLVEQYQLYLPPTWTPQKTEAWAACQNRNLASLGRWGMAALRVDDGRSVTGAANVYVWGWSDRLLPSGETVYLTEVLPDQMRFDLSDVEPTPLKYYALVDGLFVDRGTAPVAGRPRLLIPTPPRNTATGGTARLNELSLRDTDCDGVMEVELEDGTWLEVDDSGVVQEHEGSR